jgi:hypothetical protein
MNVRIPCRLPAAAVLLAAVLWGPAAPQAGPAEPLVVRHRLEVELNLQEGRLVGQDRIDLAAGGRSELVFFLSDRASNLKVGVNGSPRAFRHADARVRVPLHSAERNLPVRVEIGYEAIFDDPLPVGPLNTDNPGYGVSASITPEGVFLLGGAGWYPELAGSRPEFHLTVTAPPGILAVTAGRNLGHFERDGASVSEWRIDHPVRSLALSAAAYRVQERKRGDVVVATYLREPNQDLAPAYLEATITYLALYEELFGPYPFPKFAVVENFFPTGYGFPSYTLIGGNVLRLPFIIATSLGHEIAHCWWGNGVFVDYPAGNWSEGLTTYVADYLYQEQTSDEAARNARIQMIRNYSTLAPANRDFPLSNFKSRTDPLTKAVGYDKAAMVFHMLRREVGEDNFWGSLRDIYRDHLFRTASWQDLQKAFEERAGRSLEWFFEQWVRRPGAPQPRLEEVAVQAAGGAFQLAGRLSQEKPLFRATWEVVAETDEGPVARTVELTGGAVDLGLRSALKPNGLQVDPQAHVLRRLDPSEIPPAVNALKSSPAVTLVLAGEPAPEARRLADVLIRTLGLRQAAVLTEAELGPALPGDRDLILIGLPHAPDRLPELPPGVVLGPGFFKVGGEVFDRDTDTFFGVLRHPKSGERVIAVLHPLGRGGEEAAAKFTHYGRYGLLVFRDGVNRIKDSWPVTRSPVSVRWNSPEN